MENLSEHGSREVLPGAWTAWLPRGGDEPALD